ncbi:MAG TPA: large conductance mechanosensitive channel protein MscL [Fibrobacteraceae bacterium]|nr:large conductance mechanosensitive channel protein MscL [Fibrobacteraceae bacterium]
MDIKGQFKGKASSLMDEFKSFAFKGNIVDMAVGVIIGGAFGKIVTSMVNHIITPFVSLIMPSGTNCADWKLVVNRGTEIVDGVEKAKMIEIPYGLFLSEIVSFLIIAIVLFFVIKKFLGFMMNMKKKDEPAPAPAEPPPPPVEQVLLTEIRDLLKEKR